MVSLFVLILIINYSSVSQLTYSLIKNDVLCFETTGKSFELRLPNVFNKSLIKSEYSKSFEEWPETYSSYMIIISQLQNNSTRAMTFSLNNFKILPTSTQKIFGLAIQINIFWRKVEAMSQLQLLLLEILLC